MHPAYFLAHRLHTARALCALFISPEHISRTGAGAVKQRRCSTSALVQISFHVFYINLRNFSTVVDI